MHEQIAMYIRRAWYSTLPPGCYLIPRGQTGVSPTEFRKGNISLLHQHRDEFGLLEGFND